MSKQLQCFSFKKPLKEDNLPRKDKWLVPVLSSLQRFHCITSQRCYLILFSLIVYCVGCSMYCSTKIHGTLSRMPKKQNVSLGSTTMWLSKFHCLVFIMLYGCKVGDTIFALFFNSGSQSNFHEYTEWWCSKYDDRITSSTCRVQDIQHSKQFHMCNALFPITVLSPLSPSFLLLCMREVNCFSGPPINYQVIR